MWREGTERSKLGASTRGKQVYSHRLGEAMGAKFFGAAVKRARDPRFLRGEGASSTT
jgi:hypothetical protein